MEGVDSISRSDSMDSWESKGAFNPKKNATVPPQEIEQGLIQRNYSLTSMIADE